MNVEKRILGRTGLEVSVIGFGGIPLQRVDQEMAVQMLQRALQLGINFIDSAKGYTVSETLIGHGLKGQRQHWIIATKSMARDYAGMKADVESSLQSFQTDYIDLYQFHNVRTQGQFDEVMGENGAYKALLEAQQEGKIGHIGFTTHDVQMLEKAIESGCFSTVQFPYNIVESQGASIFEKAKAADIGVIVMKPMAGGAIDQGALALRYIMDNPNITTAIPGMDSLVQIEENASVGKEKTSLAPDEREQIQKIAKELGETFCRRCGYCGPCPQGLDIPTQFILEGYYIRYNLKDWAKERYVAIGKNANDCIACGLCEPKCPYDLPIRKMLQRVKENLS
ncbi:aldo/keto reductase [Anaerosolibacter sp.]|jgi:predicted aldo/keto reductase-like oxidoreductase|uniref:aldo/keto reductase n=1 Tax=Anaerosolibacter sp. TaxID=1872527 RepID=UPI002FE6ECAE